MTTLLVASIVIMTGLTFYILGFLHGLPSYATAKDFAIGERFKLLGSESVYYFGDLFCRHVAVIQRLDTCRQGQALIAEGDSFLLKKVGDEFEVNTMENWLKSYPVSDKDSAPN